MKRFLILFAYFIICLSLCSQVRIKMQKDSGVFVVPCEINDLRLNFIFDTGAAVISLSSSVAEFMISQGYLDEDDIYGTSEVMQADGSFIQVYLTTLRKINIGGFVLNNVDAVITPHQEAPLLLGQSAIEKLGKISIENGYLIIDNNASKHLKYEGKEKDISFLGLHQGDTYEYCYDVLSNKYGEDNVHTNSVNKIPTIYVEKMLFNNIVFDEIELYFEDGYLNSIQLNKHFDKNKKGKVKAIAFRDDIMKEYAKKYTSIKKYQLSNGFISYSIGFEERIRKEDFLKYPISLSIIEYTQQYLLDGEWEITEYYSVVLTYWEGAQKALLEKNPPQQDEF